MCIDIVPNRNSPPAVLLRESYREGGKVKERTLANLSHLAPERIQLLRRAFRGELDYLAGGEEPVSGPVFGLLFALDRIAEELGIVRALGRTRMARPAVFPVLARVTDQGSRLSAVRRPRRQAVREVLAPAPFDEDDSLRLAGCYVIETDVPKNLADTRRVHERYRDLALVERDFRTLKTGALEVRPIFLRKGGRTRGHVFVVMLARPDEHQRRILDALGVSYPTKAPRADRS